MAESEPSHSRSRRDEGRQFALHGVVVSYENGPDRCTLYPRGCSQDERTTTWLTADRSAFVDLDRMR